MLASLNAQQRSGAPVFFVAVVEDNVRSHIPDSIFSSADLETPLLRDRGISMNRNIIFEKSTARQEGEKNVYRQKKGKWRKLQLQQPDQKGVSSDCKRNLRHRNLGSKKKSSVFHRGGRTCLQYPVVRFARWRGSPSWHNLPFSNLLVSSTPSPRKSPLGAVPPRLPTYYASTSTLKLRLLPCAQSYLDGVYGGVQINSHLLHRMKVSTLCNDSG